MQTSKYFDANVTDITDKIETGRVFPGQVVLCIILQCKRWTVTATTAIKKTAIHYDERQINDNFSC